MDMFRVICLVVSFLLAPGVSDPSPSRLNLASLSDFHGQALNPEHFAVTTPDLGSTYRPSGWFGPVDLSLLGAALGVLVTGERRRLRLKAMAAELQVSERRFRQLMILGMPFTQVGGTYWFEVSEIHRWLDKFARRGRPPGIKRTKGIKIKTVAETETAGPAEQTTPELSK